VKKIETRKGDYDFVLYVDLDAEVSGYIARSADHRDHVVLYAVIFAASGIIFINTVVGPISSLAASMAKITREPARTHPCPKKKDEIGQLVGPSTLCSTKLRDLHAAQDVRGRHDPRHRQPVQILEGYRQLIERHGKNEKIIASTSTSPRSAL
jgi:hypothetical protein